MIKEIYFDNAATTKPSGDAIAAAFHMIVENFANPSSLHKPGIKAKRAIDSARSVISGLLAMHGNSVFFTSGGTEANNIAIFGAFEAHKRNGSAVITNKAEHSSVTKPYARLHELGADVQYAALNGEGAIDIQSLERALSKDTVLVSIMHVNNETGVVQNIDEIGRLIKKINKNTLFHVDCVQSFCKHELPLACVDLCTLSAHKIHGLKGTGALVVKKGVKIAPIFYGGDQQNGIRPGTENAPGIAAFAASAAGLYKKMSENLARAAEIKAALIDGLSTVSGIAVNGGKNVSPYIANISFTGVKAEVLVNALSECNIAVSTGAACHSRNKNKNVLEHYGLPGDTSVRFSFSHENTVSEAYDCVAVLKEKVAFLRKFGKK